jgi:hypothetical protein
MHAQARKTKIAAIPMCRGVEIFPSPNLCKWDRTLVIAFKVWSSIFGGGYTIYVYDTIATESRNKPLPALNAGGGCDTCCLAAYGLALRITLE